MVFRHGRMWLMLVCGLIAWGSFTGLDERHTAAQGSTPTQGSVCSQLIAQVADRIINSCSKVGGDQACLANTPLQVEYRNPADASKLPFAKPGDTLPLNALKSIQIGATNTNTGEWGAGIIKSRVGKLPSKLAGQAATIMLLGEGTFTTLDAGGLTQPEAKLCPAAVVRATSLLTSPVTDSPVTQEVPADVAIELYTQHPNGSWYFAHYQGKSGWISAESVQPGCDVKAMPQDDPAAPTPLLGLSAFTFAPSSTVPACPEIPPGSLFIESPAGRVVTFTVNGVKVTLHSSVLMQPQPSGQIDLAVLHGEAELVLSNERRIVASGFELSLPTELSGPSGKLGEPHKIVFNKDVSGFGGICEAARAANLSSGWCDSAPFPAQEPTLAMTNTPLLIPTVTKLPPTATRSQPTQVRPTNTQQKLVTATQPKPPTATQVQPTQPKPPTATQVQPTKPPPTAVPPTATKKP